MRRGIVIVWLVVGCLLMAAPLILACAVPSKTIEDNTILALILTRPYKYGGYTVVNPQTAFEFSATDFNDPQIIERYKNNIRDSFKHEDYDFTNLVDLLFERNKESVRLTLNTSPKDGYLIDFDGKYAEYFKKGGGGWEKWYLENPQAHGMTTISLPAYDPEIGVVLVYLGWQYDWAGGEGMVIAFRYENGKLEELHRLLLWMS